MSELIQACPNCDSHQIRPRSKRYGGQDWSGEGRWYCEECRAPFDEPVERPRKNNNDGSATLSPAGKAALDADPEEVAD